MPPWCLDRTLLDLTDEQKSVLSTRFSVPHHPAEERIAQKDIRSTLKDHGVLKPEDHTLSFEYIVVGGGTAGLALASRLAEDLEPGKYVCVVEAGKYREDAVIDVPGAYGMAIGKKDFDWSYNTVPQANLNDREVPSSAGRMLGGSSGINYLVRMRASSPEYDAWNKFGAGWDWEGLLPYFKAEERYKAYIPDTDEIFPGITPEEDEAARQQEPCFRGDAGPVYSTHNTVYTDLLKPTIETTLGVGIKTNRTPGYGNSTGMFNIDTAVNREEGTRSYAANAYLRDPKSPFPQPNLVVLEGYYATKIVFDSSDPVKGPRATGLKCLGGIDWKLPVPPLPLDLTVEKEIIVSSGTYNTPRLLELSGIGDPRILAQFDIPVVVDLPAVGENLQEHPFVISDFVVKDGVFTFDRLRNDPEYKAEQEKEYRERKTGAYATTVSVYGFIKFKDFLKEEDVRELKAELDDEICKANNPFYKQQLEIQREFLELDGVGDVELIMVPQAFASTPQDGTSYISLLVSLPHPVARGSVHIASSGPLNPPSINPNYLNNTYDTKILTKAVHYVQELSKTGQLSEIIVCPSTPGPNEDDFEQFVRNHVISLQHPIGTASMAPKSLGGVVDEELRVYGTQNLRVVDMSIAPLQLAAHLLDTAYAIGEKGAALVKAARRA